MLLERIYDEDLAQASYFIGCQSKGEAIVIDARRDNSEYFELAARHGMRITAVAETHIHADYLSGTRELAAAANAEAYVSGEGGDDWQYGFDATRLTHGDTIKLGNITIEARHTPGHTPEHLVFLVTDGAFSNDPGYMISGDFVFAGDLGRPDLLDEAAGGVDTRFVGAKQLFTSLKEQFLTLPDHVLVYPGHGSGSACGKALGALPATTVGYERINAWWSKHLANDDEQGFIDELLDGQPDAHAYFGRMKRENKEGPAVLGPLSPLEAFTSDQVRSALEEDRAIFVDTRTNDEVKQGTVLAALNIPAGGKFASYGAWAYDPEKEQQPLILLAADQDQAEDMRNHLMRVGIDAVKGYTVSIADLPQTQPATITPAELENFEPALLLDVRNKSEHADGHVPGSKQLSAGRVLWNQDQLPASGPIVTYCQSGVRNSVAASALRRQGHDVRELVGSYAGWSDWNKSH
ncbi:MBL fold metallo-hydrolase [Nesterenkonia sp. LB17]|uniref:MBL fold metallo-hydrolase n=1 Tax=unclassified Nesterenkonia TaxID=2629769 RepID=UPI001F4CA63B|nr:MULTISPECIES: MBL fold metallo-hydrolase [unclassified Nesterenkonia]MCH8559702.1 MBL fold metallo-hydrolase [Nesterenkonia sp. DZ6]MCH8561866.1 MBL fold metallo-hydrolase [Nesterenkonia sp. YGD6]MCH8564597.1 MBL fold metallo-hydrolase [Nesterenkonia sp. LB17]MCH8570223.1 MBL fold metallo-hydrolase [Nesterenkonia sp. AY15]